jgi:MoaA/NifB/PqqE/SkfB family radical SAM enzyme
MQMDVDRKRSADYHAVQSLLGGLNSISLELTNKCNLSCVHCYATSSPQEALYQGMTLEDWNRVLREAAAMGCETVRFIGGEPVAYPRLAELVVAAKGLGFKNLFLHTNGTHLAEGLRETLVECNVGLAFSVYAARPEVHDSVTLVRGSFARTMESIRWAISNRLKVHVSITRIADAAETDAAAALVRKMGVRSVGFDRVRRIGRGGGSSPQENVNELCGSCWQGKLCVSPAGAIHPCVFSRFRQVGSVSEGIEQAVASSVLRSFREEVYAITHESSAAGSDEVCGPEEDPGPCNPEQKPGPCGPETDPGPCEPETPQGP